jgi:beta-glucosidase
MVFRKAFPSCLSLAALLVFAPLAQSQTNDQPIGAEVWKDPGQPIDTRVADLLSRMTLNEKISQMVNNSAAIDRLEIPAYNWWSECLHGVARAGRATVFPQAIGLAATFDTDLIHSVASAISDEARAKYHAAANAGRRNTYQGLTFWSPARAASPSS